MDQWIEITTHIGCKNRCFYCPQDKIISSYEGPNKMSFSQFTRYLANVPREVDVHFSGFSEVMNHTYAIEMMSHAYEVGHKVFLYTTLVGFSGNKLEVLKNSPMKFTQVVFHEYNSESFNLSKFKEKRKLFLENAKVYSHKTLKLTWFDSRAGNLEQKYFKEEFRGPKTRLKGLIYCRSEREKKNVLLPDGKLVLCCCDWGLKHIVGDLSCEGYFCRAVEARRNKIRSLWYMEDSDVLCRNCEHAVKRKTFIREINNV